MTKEQDRRYSELANKWPYFTEAESSEFHSLLKENIRLMRAYFKSTIRFSIVSIIIAVTALTFLIIYKLL